jgi:hypothetical protein
MKICLEGADLVHADGLEEAFSHNPTLLYYNVNQKNITKRVCK